MPTRNGAVRAAVAELSNGAAAGEALHERLAAAIGHHKAADTDAAEVGYRAILAECPDEPNARHFLGVLRFQLGAEDEGLALVRASLEADPANAHAWNSLGNICVQLGRVEEAEKAYERAVEIDERMVATWYNLSRMSMRMRRFDRALLALRNVITLSRGFGSALQALAQLYYQLGRTEEAREIYAQWAAELPEDPIPRHMLAATSGEAVPDRADDRYIVGTFDGFAQSFDTQLAKLEYCAPQLVSASLMQHPLYLTGRAILLDVGCGTGWCGPLLRPTAARLVGVDLSPNMLQLARERAVYDELHEAELGAFMASRPAGFDIIVAADVLCYFGRLDEVARTAHGALRADGLFSFSVEALEDDSRTEGFHLSPAGRYAHHRSYLERVLADAGFAAPEFGAAVLRRECGKPVHGYIVSARR